MTPEKRAEIDGNFAAFEQQLPQLLQQHPGKWSVWRQRQAVEFFDTVGDAMQFCRHMFPDNRFSIQEVREPFWLGPRWE
jgi:hypothetical protein